MTRIEAMGRPTVDDGRYRLLVESITDYAIFMLDPTGCIISWNPGARRLKGYEEAEILGRHFSTFYTDEDRAAGIPARALARAGGEGRFEAEGWRVRKDGTRFWAYVIIDAIRDEAGRLLGFAKVTRDLTERRHAEEALRRSEEQFRLLVQGVTDYALFMLDADGRIANWNVGAERIKGYRAEEVLGRHLSIFYTDEDRAAGRPEHALDRARSEGRYEAEGWRVRKDGTRFVAHAVIDAIRDENGRLVGFAKITRDVTERVEAQKSLEAAREALFQAQKLEAIGQLTGGVAHDFNNLLAAILGGLELLGRRLPSDDHRARHLVDTIVHAARRGAGLTQRLLAFARRQELDVQPVDLRSLLDGMVDLLARTIGPQIAIRIDVSADLPPVSTDAHQLETALLNLVVNARDAMPDGGTIRISAGMERLAERNTLGLGPGDYVRVTTRDDGEGMDETTLKRATEPFFTTKGVGRGTGLGLSMAHGIAAQSGGALTIESRRGAGTSIHIHLPASQHAPSPVTPPASDPVGRPDPVGPRAVLVVDDDELVLASTAAMLDDLGHETIRAGSGAEALAVLETGRRVEIVVTDQLMPRMTGVELATRIRASHPEIPVILASGFAELATSAEGLFQRLAKPFSQADLAAALATALKTAPPSGD